MAERKEGLLDNEAEITLGLLNAVHENSALTQRTIARELGIALGLAEALVERYEPAQLRVLARELPELIHVARRALRREQAVQLREPRGQAVELRA